MVILANEPVMLLLDDVELESVALAEDSLNVADARLPDRISRPRMILGDKPNSLVSVRDNLREMSPAISACKLNGCALWEMLPPPTRLTVWNEVPQSGLMDALCLVGLQATKTLGCEAKCLCRFLDFISVGIHGALNAA